MRKLYPRYFQIEAVEAALRCIFTEPGENPLIVLPTGAGKSPTISWICRAILQKLPNVNIMVSAHVKELVQQNATAMRRVWPNAPYGIYSAGLDKRQTAMPITFVSVQSAVRAVASFGKINVLIIDEAHMVPPSDETNYRKLIAGLQKRNKNLVIIGLTATPFRAGQGYLTNGGIFTKIVCDYSSRDKFVRLIDEGFLIPLIPKKTDFEFDVTNVRKVAGEFNRKDLEETVNKTELTEKALQETFQAAADRNKILVFCAGIDHVEETVDMLRMYGEVADGVHSKMSDDQRDKAIEDFRSGPSRWLVNDGVLTTGFDCQGLDCIVLLRPTNSVVLHIQILGRGTRPWFDWCFENMPHVAWDLDTVAGRLAAIEASPKHNCLVLDFSGNTARLGPINDPRIPKPKGKGTGEVPVKICPKCNCYNHAAARFCDGILPGGLRCDHEFPFETKLDATAATVAVVARDAPELHWFKVDRVEYDVVQRPFTPAQMKVYYHCGLRRFTETVCIEHTTYAGKVARDWWRRRLPEGEDPPETTRDGMKLVDELPEPTHVYVHVNAPIPRVTATSFDGTTPVFKG